jgi:hypothetical protein
VAAARGAYQRCTNGGRQSRSTSKAGTSAGRGGGCAPGSGALPHRAQARAAALVVDVQTKRLTLEQRRGALISRDRAVLKTFAFARLLRDAWLAWPARIGPELAAQFGVDAGSLTVALEDAVRVHLAELHPGEAPR